MLPSSLLRVRSDDPDPSSGSFGGCYQLVNYCTSLAWNPGSIFSSSWATTSQARFCQTSSAAQLGVLSLDTVSICPLEKRIGQAVAQVGELTLRSRRIPASTRGCPFRQTHRVEACGCPLRPSCQTCRNLYIAASDMRGPHPCPARSCRALGKGR
jgi:hypothetical protein